MRYQVTPIILKRDQMLEVICDHEGKFLRVEETMPPQVNFERLPMPWVSDERDARLREWAVLEAKRYI